MAKKKVNKSNSEQIVEINLEQKKENNKINFSILIAFFSLIISSITLFLNFFYIQYDFNLSVVDGNISQDTIKINLLYQNNGKNDVALISTEMFFNNDSLNKNKENRLYFINKKELPVILSNGKKSLNSFSQPLFFDSTFVKKLNLKKDKKIRLNLDVQFINDNSLQAEKIIDCGWIILDSLYKIDNYYIKYQNIDLKSDEYFVSGYSKKSNKSKQ